MADLSMEVDGIRFKNSAWLASGEPTSTFDKMKHGIDVAAAEEEVLCQTLYAFQNYFNQGK